MDDNRNIRLPVLRTAFDMIYKKRGNCLIGITGSVNTGKSHLAVGLGYLFYNKFKLEESLCYSVEALLKKSLLTVKYKGKPLTIEYVKDIEDVPKWFKENYKDIHITPGKVMIMDEAGALGAYVREFYSMDNKTISKIIQIWRILRMLVIFVIPEDISLAESTISRFLNIEVRMVGISPRRNQAGLLAYKYIGYNKKTKERVRKRLQGCRYGGVIWVDPLPDAIQEQYEMVSRTEKLSALVDLMKQYVVTSSAETRKRKSVWDYVKDIQKNPEKYHSDKGVFTISSVRTGLGVSYHTAAQIRQALHTHDVSSNPIYNKDEKQSLTKKDTEKHA